MTRFRGKIIGALAMLAFAAAACGQTPEAVSQVVPIASPNATPEAGTSPTASPTPAEIATPSTPSITTGTTPVLSGTGPVVTGTEATPSPTPPNPYSIEIDLEHQHVFLLKDGQKIAEAPISSGRAGHLTPTGNFSVIEKDPNHVSNLYGKIVDKDSGRTVKSGADIATPVPKGCKFVPAPMKWFMRFDGATGMHAGILPGYPASHGCVRMPLAKAELFYSTVTIGTPVHVFGNPPLRASHEEAENSHPKPAAPKASPTPTPRQKHGWWIF